MARLRSSLLAAGLLFRGFANVAGFEVEVEETLSFAEAKVEGEYDRGSFRVLENNGGVDPIDAGCPPVGKCVGAMTRDKSLDLDSRYGCTRPVPDEEVRLQSTCGVTYYVSESSDTLATISAVKIALHPDSITTLSIVLNNDESDRVEWEATAGTAEMQEISALQGLRLSSFEIEGVMEVGEYLGILETEIFVEVDEVETVGTSLSTRTDVTATATSDADSAMNTLDGDITDTSSWTCSSGEVCEITYDLQAPESLEQLRIVINDDTNAGGSFNFLVAGESGEFYPIRSGVEAGGRPPSSDGLQTFGAVRALARYVKIEAVPASGGVIVINEVEIRVGIDASIHPVAEKAWLKPTGPLPRGGNPFASVGPDFDSRAVSDGGCDSPAHFEGCDVYYVKDGDMDSRWSCGQTDGDCEVDFSLNYYRYVQQVQFAFHQGDEEHVEFKIRARTTLGWVTVAPSAISSGNTPGYQTFDIKVHANRIRLIPVFQRQLQWIGINEMVVLERRKNDFISGTVPVFKYAQSIGFFGDDIDMDIETPTCFRFDLPDVGDWMRFTINFSEVTAVRIRFPANREFVFQIEYEVDDEDFIDEFTSAGGANTWETFTLSEVSNERNELTITAVSGPSFANSPDYPALRVVDFQIVGEPVARPAGYFQMVSTYIDEWGVIPNIVADGISDQEDIMTAICEAKGATFDGTDCAGELDDTIVDINMILGDFFLDGPIYMKSGVTLDGTWIDEAPTFSFLWLYEGSNFGNVAEDAIIVIDGVTDAEVNEFVLGWDDARTDDIVPGTLGNLGVDVKNSQALRFDRLEFPGVRNGAVRFVDSSNITTFLLGATFPDVGNYMDLVRVDDFSMKAFGGVPGLLIEDCNNVIFEGVDDFGVPTPSLDPPTTTADQTASVVITGDTSGVVFMALEFGESAEPRVLMESTSPLTLDSIVEYEDAAAGDCIIQVPEGTTEDLIVQVNSEETLSKAGNCWVLD